MTSKTFFQTMSDNKEICVNRWIPETEIKAVIVISHGMAEHSLRYDKHANIFVEAGFAVTGHDARGHGKTAQKQKEKGEVGFGYLSDKKGYERVIEDLNEVIEETKKEFPGKKIFLFAHSWGSFVGQGYIEKYGSNIDGCFLCGTRGPDPAAPVKGGLFLSNLFYLFGRKKKTSYFLQNLSFNGYLKRIPDSRTANDWLTKDNSVVDMYMADDWCGFVMTTEFYHDLFKLLLKIHNPSNIKMIPQSLPLYLMCGKEDPVGNYGKTVENLYNIYKANGIKDLTLKLYDDDRHELLNETDGDKIIKEMIQWIEQHL